MIQEQHPSVKGDIFLQKEIELQEIAQCPVEKYYFGSFSEAMPQTDEFVCVYQLQSLPVPGRYGPGRHRHTGCWMLDVGQRSRL